MPSRRTLIESAGQAARGARARAGARQACETVPPPSACRAQVGAPPRYPHTPAWSSTHAMRSSRVRGCRVAGGRDGWSGLAERAGLSLEGAGGGG